jgi:enoyl-[acyl-carrier-protein] reductase (NADH)
VRRKKRWNFIAGKKGLVIGIANDASIAWGCAKAFRDHGAEIAVTYLNDKTKAYVQPLAEKLNAPICMQLIVPQLLIVHHSPPQSGHPITKQI